MSLEQVLLISRVNCKGFPTLYGTPASCQGEVRVRVRVGIRVRERVRLKPIFHCKLGLR